MWPSVLPAVQRKGTSAHARDPRKATQAPVPAQTLPARRRGPELIGAALACATQWQWPVLPGVAADARGRCACPDPDCTVPGAHPFDPGLLAASTDARMVRWWWTNRPSAPIILATGGSAPCAVSLPALAASRALAALDRQGMRLGPVVASCGPLVHPRPAVRPGTVGRAAVREGLRPRLPALPRRGRLPGAPAVEHRPGRRPLGARPAARLVLPLGARRGGRGGRGRRRPHSYGCERPRVVGVSGRARGGRTVPPRIFRP